MVHRQGVSKGLLTLLGQVDALAPRRDIRNDGTIGDKAHQGRESDHNPDGEGRIRALDITKDLAHGVDVQKIADQIIASRDPRMKYMIHNQRMVRSYPKTGKTPWVWYDEQKGHEEHLHVSTVANNAIADDTSPWKISLGTQPMQQIDSFEQRAVAMMPRLMKDLVLHDFQAAGMVGNFGQESRMGELFHQVGGNAIGLAQWDGDRKQQFLDFCASIGKAPEDPESSYSFLIKELLSTENTSLKALKATETLEDATEVFCKKFERPGKPMMEKRLAYAERALEAYKATSSQEPEMPGTWEPEPPQGRPWLPSTEQGFPQQSPIQQGGLGNFFGVIQLGMEIFALMKQIPKGMTVEEGLSAVKAGFQVAVYGQPNQALQIEAPRSQPMSSFGTSTRQPSAQAVTSVVTEIKPAMKSKINWTQAIAGVLQALNLGTALAGGLDPKYGVAIAGGLGIVSNAITWVQRTFFTTDIAPQSVTADMLQRRV